MPNAFVLLPMQGRLVMLGMLGMIRMHGVPHMLDMPSMLGVPSAFVQARATDADNGMHAQSELPLFATQNLRGCFQFCEHIL